MISEKIKNIYKGDKELRDSEATAGIVNRNKSYTTKSHEDYKKFVLENRSHLKDLLDKRRVERVSLAKESNQPNIEELTKPDSNILHRVSNLSHDQIISNANKRSAAHKNHMGSLHITHNSMNDWDNHNKLPLKAIKKVKRKYFATKILLRFTLTKLSKANKPLYSTLLKNWI
jgi:predicted  nucleic acid-binding Zn-ribbon protein